MFDAIAYLPECRPDAADDAWLDWLQTVGYTGIYVEPDPFAPARSGNMSQFPALYRLISLYDLAWGPNRERLRAWIGDLCTRAHRRGMRVYLALWEPRIPAEAWGLFPKAWHGRGGWDRQPWNHISWCLGEPAARAAFTRMATEAFRAVSAIDGLKIGSHDNDACLCNDDCPRCAGRSKAESLGLLFDCLVGAIDEAGIHRPDFEYVLYTWWWGNEERGTVAAKLEGRRVAVLGRLSQGLPQMWQGQSVGTVFDLALGQPGIGDGFRETCRTAAERGWRVFDMPGFGHAIEYFWQPYTPAPNRIAEILAHYRELGVAGWFDYDCGGVYPGINTEIIRTASVAPELSPAAMVAITLQRLYPAGEQDVARAAYAAAEAGLAARPIALSSPDVPLLSGRNTMEVVIALPFDPGDISGFDQGHRIAFFAPTDFLTANTVPTLLAMNRTSAAHWATADERFRELTGRGTWGDAVLPWEKRVVRAHALASASAARYVEMADCRLARGRGELDAVAERELLVPLLEEELTASREYAAMWREDRRLLANSNIRLSAFLQMCQPWRRIDADNPFTTKENAMTVLIAGLREGQLDAVPSWPVEAGETSR